MSRVIASIEARMSASRLPGKVLADVCGKPALSRLLSRLKRCKRVDGIVVATSINERDDAIADWAEFTGVPCYRGSEDDVLNRVLEAQRHMRAEVSVEICGDMILLDPDVVDEGIKTFIENDFEIVTTTFRPSYPVGVDVVVFGLKELEWVEKHARDPEYREHVSLYFLHHPEKYKIFNLMASPSLAAPDLRFVLDYPEDLEFIRAVYSRLGPTYGDGFGLKEILELLQAEPELTRINQHCSEKTAP